MLLDLWERGKLLHPWVIGEEVSISWYKLWVWGLGNQQGHDTRPTIIERGLGFSYSPGWPLAALLYLAYPRGYMV